MITLLLSLSLCDVLRLVCLLLQVLFCVALFVSEAAAVADVGSIVAAAMLRVQSFRAAFV